jgi:hypothetical protein
MGEFANDASFAKEAVAGVTASELRREEFDGNGTIDEGIMTANDTAVSAGAESFVDLITADLHE